MIDHKPYNPVTIANYFIKKYPDGNLTPMKVLKLVYIAYGWYLSLSDGKKLMDDTPQAWELGPVLPKLYHAVQKYRELNITDPLKISSNDMITDDDAQFLDKIWQIFGDKDGIYLSAITHMPGTPWAKTYPKGHKCIISDKLIKEYYKKLEA